MYLRAGLILAHLEHAKDGGFRALADLFVHRDLRIEVEKAIMQLRHGIHLHVATVGATALVRRTCDEVLVRSFFAQAVQHAGLCHDDDVLGRAVLAEIDHLLCGANFVC